MAPNTQHQAQSRGVFEKTYTSVGFSKGYNFILWFTFAGALFGFVCARLVYLDITGVFCGPDSGMNHAAPGECYYYLNFNQYAIGIRLHLYTILPAGLLVVFQFTPVIRHKLLLFHRINGYLIILLALASNAGALMITREAFGGTLATQAFAGTLFILTTVGLALAYYNIKRLQIDQHRAWMLRTWFYFSTIITFRVIMIISAMILAKFEDGLWSAQKCVKLLDIVQDAQQLVQDYPACASLIDSGDVGAVTAVRANFNGTVPQIAAALNESFGMSGWIALTLHAIGVEAYLHLTPKESNRLRQISFERQSGAGFKNPGRAGIVAEYPTFEIEQQMQPVKVDRQDSV